MKSTITGPVRVRFAPSPTGYLHVGGARTAIYNELLRQSLGGSFILRIEDTDKERSDEAMIAQIRDALTWMGVRWDEGPFLQSARVEAHREAARRLLASGQAYHDFVTPEELEEARRRSTSTGGALRYRDVFAPPSSAEVARRLDAGEPYAVRFRMPDRDVRIDDLVRGEVVFGAEVLDDFIVLRTDGSPTYHLSVVVDDVDMGITHVIRGEDHLSNTPKHIALFRALGARVPEFGHLPLILGSDRKRLSKRTGATSAEEFRDQGILPQALYNYLALLGWSPGDDREVMSREEMIAAFAADRLGSSASVFDHDKLAWMNAQYMSGLPLAELLEEARPFLDGADLDCSDLDAADPGRLERVLELVRTRARTLRELPEWVEPYFRESHDYDPEACTKFLAQEALPEWLETLIERYAALEPFTIESTEAVLREVAAELDVGAGKLIHPTRMALTARPAGPPLFDVVVVMGREASLRHLRNFVAFLRDPRDSD